MKSISFKVDCAASPSNHEYISYSAYDINGNLLYTYDIAASSLVQNSNTRFDLVMDPNYDVYSIKVSRNANAAVVIGATLGDGNGFVLCDKSLDTDGDGIPNHLDLDSDGDTCPDAVESRVDANPSTAGQMSTSGGSIYTGGIAPGTANAYVGNGTPSQYGANGFFDAIETSSESGVYNGGVGYYYNYAISTFINRCIDNDGDGIIDINDIDDDNDGVLDAVESPSCYYTANEWITTATPDYIVSISSELTTTLNNFNHLVDAVSNVSAVAFSSSPAQAIQNKNVYLLKFVNPIKLDALYLQFNTATQFAGTTKIQGSNTNNGSDWVDLSAAISQTPGTNVTVNAGVSIANSIKYPVTLNATTAYKYIRITGVAASNIVAQNASEIYFELNTASYIPSLYPKKDCTNDTDGDGTINQWDLNSDNDGCSDALESGATTVNSVAYQFPNVDFNGDGLVDAVDPDGDGKVNYNSTYNPYAISNLITACTDTDADGITDVVDIDDDNDGVLDAIESPACFYTSTEAMANQTVKVSTYLNSSTVNSAAVTVGNDIAGMHDGTTTSVTTSNHVIATNQLGSTNNVIYKLEYPTSVGLTQVVVTGATANWGTSSFAILEASNDDINYTAVSAQIPTSSGTTKTWPVTLNTSNLYKYYRIRVSTVGSTQPTFTNYEVAGTINTATFAPSAHPKLGVTCNADFDGDLIPNHLDTDSDNDGCSDAWEAGVINYITTNGGVYSSGILTNPNNTTSSYTTVGSNTPADYGANGFYDLLETSGNGVYLGTYTYSNVTNSSIANCPVACYKPAITAGTVLDTKQGITSFKRAGADHDNWPMVRKGAWTALESRTKGFVPNRLTAAEISSIPAANLVEGMMVYNKDLDCLYINTNGTPTGWKCFNTQTCP